MSTSPSTDAPLPDRKAGVSLSRLLADFLRTAVTGPASAVADQIAAGFVATLADADTLRDDAGRLWAAVPVFDEGGNVLPFDRRNVAALECAAADILVYSPEASAVFGGVVYPSAFRQARIAKVMWLGRGGEVTDPSDIFNSLDTATMLVEGMMARLRHRQQFELDELNTVLGKKRDAYESLQQEAAPPTQT